MFDEGECKHGLALGVIILVSVRMFHCTMLCLVCSMKCAKEVLSIIDCISTHSQQPHKKIFSYLRLYSSKTLQSK